MAYTVIFFGTSDFSATVLKGLISDPQFEVAAVVSQPDRPVGRKHLILPTQSKQIALDNDIPVFQTEKLSGSKEMDELINLKADFLVTAAFGQFVPTRLLRSASIAAVNVHASLLPKYRGAAPINWALINGDDHTGISIMYMVKEMDAGDIISTIEVPIEPTDDAGSLFKKLAVFGRDLLLKSLPLLAEGKIQPIKQDPEKITLAPKIDHKLTELNFYKQTAKQIVDLTRGLSPKPGTIFDLDGHKIKLYQAAVGPKFGEVGRLSIKDKHQLGITAADGKVVLLKKVQPAGKKNMLIEDFLNGVGRSFNVGDWTKGL
ncbi:methionyl-tRNA formyltransferase [Oenococcus alcoholitolerans]|uniref:methionyl-tRNA formyltransferase n=1 Tax=Oenococcus alcoholitolerans TaxID=931074 RepID=UPI003F6F6DCB